MFTCKSSCLAHPLQCRKLYQKFLGISSKDFPGISRGDTPLFQCSRGDTPLEVWFLPISQWFCELYTKTSHIIRSFAHNLALCSGEGFATMTEAWVSPKEWCQIRTATDVRQWSVCRLPHSPIHSSPCTQNRYLPNSSKNQPKNQPKEGPSPQYPLKILYATALFRQCRSSWTRPCGNR